MDYNYYNLNPVLLPMENQSYSNYNSVQTMMPNRFVYVNQNFLKPKVLINPNFKKTVHINPNFKGTIHVNPNIMKLQEGALQKRTNCDNNNDQMVANKTTNDTKSNIEIDSPGITATERRQSVHTKYKIVHTKNRENYSQNQKQGVRSKYKIDKRINVCDRTPNVKKIIKTRYKLLNTNVINNKSQLKTKRNNKLISINGVLYKKTPNVLKKADLSNNKLVTKQKLKVLKINGRMYKLNCSTSSMSSKSRSSTSRSISKKKVLLSQTKNFNKQVFLSKMRKCNIPCPIYRKFGKCFGKNKGTCFRIHNPDQVALCTRFLQGACRKKNCLLSHKVSAEKMPTCKYYLEGLCMREDCPYLHVKINPKADICKDFIEGFCKKAKECDKRHQFLCPEYEKTGSCPRKHCQFPHGDVVSTYYLKAKVAKKTIKVFKAKIDKLKVKRIQQREGKAQVDNNEKNVRYYIDTTGNDKNLEIITNDDNEKVEIDEMPLTESPVPSKRRKSVGDLPSFIPLGD